MKNENYFYGMMVRSYFMHENGCKIPKTFDCLREYEDYMDKVRALDVSVPRVHNVSDEEMYELKHEKRNITVTRYTMRHLGTVYVLYEHEFNYLCSQHFDNDDYEFSCTTELIRLDPIMKKPRFGNVKLPKIVLDDARCYKKENAKNKRLYLTGRELARKEKNRLQKIIDRSAKYQ